jgi:hypothetical protein
MKEAVRYRALEAFCRQRSQMEGEGSEFWLTEADILAKLRINAVRLEVLKEAERPPNLGPET